MKTPLEVLNTYRPHNGTLEDAFSSRCKVKPDAPFIFQENRTWSWSEFDEDYKKLAQALHLRGVSHGMRIAIMGRNDADGYYYHLSRKKDIIRRRGENIAAAELEMVIGELPGIYQVAAIGLPSELGEDDILIAAVKKPGAVLSEQDIVEWCRQRLTAVKVPRFVSFLEALPLTPTHKILKTALRTDPQVRARAIDFQVAKSK